MAIIQTLKINFESDEDDDDQGALKLELDSSRPNNLNNGKSTFRPGDNVNYLLFKTNELELTEHDSTDGSIKSNGSGILKIGPTSEKNRGYLEFSNTDEVTLPYPAKNGLTNYKWLGKKSLGTISVVDGGAKLKAAESGFAILQVTYDAPFSIYQLSGVSLTVPQVMVWAIGEFPET